MARADREIATSRYQKGRRKGGTGRRREKKTHNGIFGGGPLKF
jgi:hypothetical protein